MKIAILGAGQQAKGALEFIRAFNVSDVEVVLCDMQLDAARKLANIFNTLSIEVRSVEGNNLDSVIAAITGCDGVFNALPYTCNYIVTLAATKAHCHVVDLGGNNDVVAQQRTLNSELSTSVVVDCGVAPGLVGVIASHAVAKLDEVDRIRMRVGGLPSPKVVSNSGPLQYTPTFSMQGLVNEYVEPVVRLRNGVVETIEPLSELERITVRIPDDSPQSEELVLEAFTTSGGASNLPHYFQDDVNYLDYKTLRYPGHCRVLHALRKVGKLDAKTLQALSKPGLGDCIILQVEVNGWKGKRKVERLYQMYCHGVAVQMFGNSMPGTILALSAMAQATAWPAMITLLGLCKHRDYLVSRARVGVSTQVEDAKPAPFLRAVRNCGLKLWYRDISKHEFG